MAIKSFADRDMLRALRAEIDAALAPIAARHGITLAAGHISYEAAQCTIKVVATIPEAKASRDRELLVTFCMASGLDPDKVSHDGYRLVGFDTKRHKRPWIAEKGGKNYVFDDRGAQARWASATAPRVVPEIVDNLARCA